MAICGYRGLLLLSERVYGTSCVNCVGMATHELAEPGPDCSVGSCLADPDCVRQLGCMSFCEGVEECFFPCIENDPDGAELLEEYASCAICDFVQ